MAKKQAGSIRVLIYSQDGFGLGHLRRNLNISLQIKKQCPSASILIIADSPVAPFFKLPPKCDFIKLPTIVKVDTGIWRPNRLPMHYQELLKIRADIIQNVMLSFRPHIFLVDHMPHGALGELARPLDVLKRTYPETRIILGLRDILGAQDVIHKMWQDEGAFEAAEQFYDAICIYGCQDVFNLTEEYDFPSQLVANSRYCGYVARENRAGKKRATGTPGNGVHGKNSNGATQNEKFILVTGGGGADASYFMDKFIEAARRLNGHYHYHALISTGPFLHEKQYQLLQKKARGTHIQIRRIGADSIPLIKKADLIVSMAGYNTISEIMRFRKNAVVIPRPGPSAEQTIRTNILTDRGIIHSMHPTELTAEKLADLIADRLENGNGMAEDRLPDLNGAVNAARHLLAHVKQNT
ncbi:MAG: glycosyltransferase [candidate division KSB1 bacterium]|nr:glycosyltransferase [candidate division KSB1 bacterium]